jgi:hypothetical protein
MIFESQTTVIFKQTFLPRHPTLLNSFPILAFCAHTQMNLLHELSQPQFPKKKDREPERLSMKYVREE